RDMNTMISSLRDAIDSTRDNYNMLATKATSSDETKVVATGTAKSVSGTYTLNVTQLAKAATLTNDASQQINSTDLFNASGTETITLNGKTINLVQNTNAADIVSKINEKTAETGVKASYDATAKQISFTTTKTGASANISFSTTDSALNAKFTTTSATGVNAKVSMDGGATVDFESNTFTYRDINFQLKTGTAAVSVTVEPDVDKVYNTIKGFVDKYNEVIDKINTKVTEQRYRDFTPLTDEQKQEMKDADIKNWEDKAKSGLLRSDSTLTNLLDRMRTQISSAVSGMASGTYDTLSKIGITTAGANGDLARFNFKENGKLYIDESKLKDAIRANPDQVAQLFTKSGTGATNADIQKTSGYGDRLRGVIDSTLNQLVDIAGKSSYAVDTKSQYGTRISDLNKRIVDENSQLKDVEDRYWKQFAAMEAAINNMNSQQQWLTQQFAGGGM
ncbi:MAG: flagellar filament capping protein FliD, partial [Tumebacillaceae bacterium]